MFKLFKVRGESMLPNLAAGDVLLLRYRKPIAGEIVVIDHPKLGMIVKRLDADGGLSGDNPESTSRERLGQYADCRPVGTAILAITPSGLRRLSGRRSGNRA